MTKYANKKFLDIPDVKKAFHSPENSPVGQTFKDVIDSLDEISILHLQIGSKPTNIV